MSPASTHTYLTFTPGSRSNFWRGWVKNNHQFWFFTSLSKEECPSSSASSSVNAGAGGRATEGSCPATGRNSPQGLCDGAEPSPPLQKQERRDILGSLCVRLLTCTICSCRSQSISAFLNCWNAFLNTVIYPQKNWEHTPSPPQCHVLLTAAPSHTPPSYLCREGRNPPPEADRRP